MKNAVKWLCRMGLAAGLAATSQAAIALPSSGAHAPDFALRSTSGKNVRLSEYRGQVVMINFWATWCGPCRQELPLLNQIYGRYRNAGFVVLAVNVEEDANAAVKMAHRLNLGFPVLLDGDKRVSRLYDPTAMPVTVLVDRNGRVRHVHLGYKAGYEADYEREVRELLQE